MRPIVSDDIPSDTLIEPKSVVQKGTFSMIIHKMNEMKCSSGALGEKDLHSLKLSIPLPKRISNAIDTEGSFFVMSSLKYA